MLSVPLPRNEKGKLIKRGKKSSVGYLVELVGRACEEKLSGPMAVLRWLQDRVTRAYERDVFVWWDSPSRFPCRNLEEPPNEIRVKGVKVASGTKIRAEWTKEDQEHMRKQLLKSITANFTHSMDAAHAALSINAAVRLGITNIITCHDCFCSHAPKMWEVQRDAVLVALRDMYRQHDPLHELWLCNGADGDPPPKFMDDETFFAVLGHIPSCDFSFS